MRKFAVLALLAAPVFAYAAAAPDNSLKWAYPVEPPPGQNADAAPPSKPINPIAIAITYTGLPRMPEVVARGKPLPCMQCHLANGGSHPESAAIAGMSVNYIIEQPNRGVEAGQCDSFAIWAEGNSAALVRVALLIAFVVIGGPAVVLDLGGIVLILISVHLIVLLC